MTAPMKTLRGWRLVAVHRGDTLQAIALRELGDADLWRELIQINDLAPPYLTDDPALAGPRVRLAGEQIRVPSATVYASAVDDPDRVFGADAALTHGRLSIENGDLALVSGRANLDQAIANRLDTPQGDLAFHPPYGCKVHTLKGQGNTPANATLGGAYVKGALLNDPRIQQVPAASAQVVGDALILTATVQPISGSTIDAQTTV